MPPARPRDRGNLTNPTPHEPDSLLRCPAPSRRARAFLQVRTFTLEPVTVPFQEDNDVKVFFLRRKA